ncbi:MAG: ABC transporter permease, partial [Actinomycetia bacterium]|nr:ABC transporter permease [Actinomycetes bacterium]
MIAWSTARYRWRTLLGSFLALALGIGLLASAAIVIASASAQPDPRYASAEVLVAPEVVGETQTLDDLRLPWSTDVAQRLVGDVRGLDGVREAAADYGFPVEVLHDGHAVSDAAAEELLGHNWSSRVLGDDELVDGTSPTGTHQVVLPAAYGIEPGAQVTLSTPLGAPELTVMGTTSGSTTYVADELAQRWSTGSDALGVDVADGADVDEVAAGVRDVVGADADVLTGSDRSTLENAVDRSNRYVGAQLLTAMGVLASFVSVFVVATTFAFVVAQRRREIGLLRAIGATPRQVRRMLLGEALVVGAVASLAGALLGLAGAPLLGGWMVDAGMQARGWEPTTVALPLAGSVLTGVVVALAGVWAASRRAARTSPLQALRESSVEHRVMTPVRWVVGVAALVAGTGMATATASVEGGAVAGLAVGAVAAFVTGLTLLAPTYLPTLVRLVCPARGPSAEMVRAEAAVGVRRVASLLAPVLVTVAFTVTITGMINTMAGSVSQDARADLPTPRVLVPDDETVGVPDSAIDALGTAGGRVAADLPTGAVIDGQWQDAVGSERVAVERGAIAASPDAARDHGWRDGDRVELTWADGRTSTVRVEVVDDLQAAMVLDRSQAREHDPAAVAQVGYLDVEDPAALRSIAPPQSHIEASSAYESADNAEEEHLLRLFVIVLLGLSMGFTVLAIANTMLMASSERRRDYAVLRLAGAHTGQVARFVGIETAVVVLVGGVLG